MKITHHGAVKGVTGSCHRLTLPCGRSVLVDCGLFQGAETSSDGRAGAGHAGIDFDVADVQALLITHVHIDHVGRLPQLIAAGFKGPMLCSMASAALLPLVLEDAVKVGFGGDETLLKHTLRALDMRLRGLPYGAWLPLWQDARSSLRLRLQVAGHILGSAYVELEGGGAGGPAQRVIFSGDLGAPHTPLLPDPTPPTEGCDVLVLESTYGNRVHAGRAQRRAQLKAVCERALANGGTVLIPAFSVGRTQELLYELEQIIHDEAAKPAAPGLRWADMVVVVDSPLAADFTRGYQRLKADWDEEAKAVLKAGRHPLDFSRLRTVGPHDQHMQVVRHLASSGEPAIVIAASGMCSGGRIVHYLQAMLPDARHDVLFCGYQAEGTPGRALQACAEPNGQARPGAHIMLEGEAVAVRAHIHNLSGYSAHADQHDLLNFVAAMPAPPKEIRLVHGDAQAKSTLAQLMQARWPGSRVWVPQA